MSFKSYIPFYKRNLRVAFPIIITQAGQIIVQFVDNIMVGHLGAAQLAGVSFANALFLIGLVCSLGFAIGSTPVVGKYFGGGDDSSVAKTFSNSLFLNIVIGFVLTIVLLLVGLLMDFMGQQPEVLHYARNYYFINVGSVMFLSIFFCIRYLSEGIGNTKYAMWITIISNALNIFLNWILIYGKLGIKPLGVEGAAYATLISRALSAIVFAVIIVKKEEYLKFLRLIKRPFIEKKSTKEILKISIPSATQALFEEGLFSICAIIVGWIGTYELAAHQIGQNLSTLTFMVSTGIGSAATIRVSHQYGAGRYQDMRKAAIASLHMSIAFMLLCGIIFVVFNKGIPAIFTNDSNVFPIASTIILIVAAYQIFDATQLGCISALRGVGDVKIPLYLAMFSYYVVSIPVGCLLAFVAGLGVYGIWIGLLFGLMTASILFSIRLKRTMKRIIDSNGLEK